MSVTVSPQRLEELVRAAAGLPPTAFPDDLLTKPFADIGLDSLALLEIVGVVQREFHVVISDHDLAGLANAAELGELINRQAAAA